MADTSQYKLGDMVTHVTNPTQRMAVSRVFPLAAEVEWMDDNGKLHREEVLNVNLKPWSAPGLSLPPGAASVFVSD